MHIPIAIPMEKDLIALGGNLLAESRDEQTISAQTGDVDGTAYRRVTLADYGLGVGDVISIQGKAKRT